VPRRPSFPYRYSYPRPMLTVDVAPLRVQRGRLELLLIRRDKDPFPGHWALPGGFVEENEPLATAARRELWEETRLEPLLLQQVRTFATRGAGASPWPIWPW
jgi:8-oxo-dGTP diphosphatase